MKEFGTFVNEDIHSIEPEFTDGIEHMDEPKALPGPGTHGTICLAHLDDDEIDAITNNDSTTAEWLQYGRIELVDNELWVAEDDIEVIGYFNDNYGFEDSFED